jgi:hypothetical protein
MRLHKVNLAGQIRRKSISQSFSLHLFQQHSPGTVDLAPVSAGPLQRGQQESYSHCPQGGIGSIPQLVTAEADPSIVVDRRDCEMNCSRDEALLILGKWCADRANLLLAFQASVSTEVVRLRGRISRLDTEGLLFVSTACSVSVPFESATFEYKEVASDVLLHGQKQRRAACFLQLQLPARKVMRAMSSATTLASSVISITEAIR